MTNEIFSEFDKNPISLFQKWLSEAEKSEPNDPNAVCLATADKNGVPSARMVLLKDICPQKGFKFHTNSQSPKGHDIAQNNHVSFCIHWKSLHKQIRVSGTAALVDTQETKQYFSSRNRNSQIGAWASKQSQPYNHKCDLAKAVEDIQNKFIDTSIIPKPDHWQGYWIIPSSIEFWIEGENRLHRRFIYSKNNQGNWAANWLYP